MNMRNINAQTDEFISQVDQFLSKKQPNIQQETHNFLQLLGKIDDDQKENSHQHSLSIIYSESESSTHRSNYQFVGKYVNEMMSLLKHPHHNTLQIQQVYLSQMSHIDSKWNEIMQSVVSVSDMLKRKNQVLTEENNQLKTKSSEMHNEYLALNTELSKVRSVELELKKSLEQAQSFNERLSKLLAHKVNEQRFKDTQCKALQTQLTDLSNNVNDFQTQFIGINSLIKNLYERIQDIYTYNSEHINTNRVIEGILEDSHTFIDKLSNLQSASTNNPNNNTQTTRTSTPTKLPKASQQNPTLNTFRTHFVVTPKKTTRNDSGSRQSHNSERPGNASTSARRKDIENQYRQIFKNFK